MNQLPEPDTRPVAFFDFDGTLTTGDTLMPFLKFVVGKPTYYTKLALLSPVLSAYFAKLLRNDIAKQIVLKQYLAGYHIDELFTLGKRFSEEVIPNMLREEGVERLRWHRAQGHRCVLLSASLDVYLEETVKALRFDELISSRLEYVAGGRVTGSLSEDNCFGETKVKKIKEWLLSNSPAFMYGYGDSKGDYPFLRFVDQGWVIRNESFLDVKEQGVGKL